MKVPVKNYSNMDLFRQVKNTELTRSFIIWCLCCYERLLIEYFIIVYTFYFNLLLSDYYFFVTM